MSKREELYARIPPPKYPIPWNVDPNAVIDAIPMDSEIREQVRGLSNSSMGGISFMHAEDLK